jgi:hypothetical protein
MIFGATTWLRVESRCVKRARCINLFFVGMGRCVVCLLANRMTSCCCDVTSCCCDLTSCCCDVTSCCCDVTSRCCDTTSCCCDAMAVWPSCRYKLDTATGALAHLSDVKIGVESGPRGIVFHPTLPKACEPFWGSTQPTIGFTDQPNHRAFCGFPSCSCTVRAAPLQILCCC